MALGCVFFVWKEYQRNMAYRLLRIVAMIGLWISLAGLVLKPGFSHLVTNQDILLTYGYPAPAVDSLLKTRPGANIYRTPDAAPYAPGDQVVSAEEILTNKVHYGVVMGVGLQQDQLDRIDTSNYYFIQAPIPDGIIDLSWPEHVVPGRTAVVQGTIHTSVKTTLSLHGPAGREDSVIVNQGGSFSLRFTPRAPGRFLYRIRTSTAEGVKEEILPVVVQSPRMLRVLILQQFPTAEIRYLKNLLSSQGHQLIIRYQISQSKFRYEYANQAPKRFERLNSDLLSATDLVIGDPGMLSALSRGELDALQEAVHNGLGILSLVDEPGNKQPWQRLLPLSFQSFKSDTIHLGGLTFNIASVKPIADPRMKVVIQNTGRIAAGYTFLGSGKSGFQLLQETYRLLLRGERDAYTNLWVQLIEETSRQRAVTQIRPGKTFPLMAGERTEIELITAGTQAALTADGILLPLQEDVLIDDVWYAQPRFNEPGWHQLISVPDSVRRDVFVHPAGAWKSVRDYEQIRANQWKASRPSPGGRHIEETPISPLVLFLCFLFSAGLLWLAPKL